MLLRTHHPVLCVLFCVLAPAAAKSTTGFRQQIFNGHNLHGWHAIGCETGVEGNKLILRDGDGTVRTDHRYRNFVLELKWRPLRKDSWDDQHYLKLKMDRTHLAHTQRNLTHRRDF